MSSGLKKQPLLLKVKPVFAALNANEDHSLVQCHICRKWYGELGTHIYGHHKMPTREYRIKYGLAFRTPLCSEKRREMKKRDYYKWLNKLSIKEKEEFHKKQVENSKKGRAISLRNGKLSHPIRPETIRKRGMARDQILQKILEITELNGGKSPSQRRFINLCGTQRYKHKIYELFGSWSNAIKEAGLEPADLHPTGWMRSLHTNESLLECLNMFAKRNNRLPAVLDFGHGLLPAYDIYLKHFKSIEEARVKSGVYKMFKKQKYNYSRKGMKYGTISNSQGSS